MWFKTLNLAGRALLPIVQGGMGVGISAHRLAGAVASENAVGTIASVNLRHHHPDLLDATDRCHDRDTIDQANRVALDREIRAAKLEEINEERFNFDRVIRECRALFDELALGRDAPKLIVAGGLGSHEQARYWLNNGADAIQVGTAFAVTEEGDAHAELKRVLIEANPDDLKSFISVAGLPARAVGTPWLMRYLRQENTLQANTRSDSRRCSQRMDCLSHCGLRDGVARFGQFCIDLKLAAAMRGEVEKGSFFRGRSKLPFDNAIRSVRELIDHLLNGSSPIAVSSN